MAFLYAHRAWLLAASGVTLFLLILENDNTACLNWAQSPNLTGFDVLVPVLTRVNLFSGAVVSQAFSIHPLGLLTTFRSPSICIFFVKHTVPARWTFWQGVVQTGATVLPPFTHIAVLTWVLPGLRLAFGIWIRRRPIDSYEGFKRFIKSLINYNRDH